MGEIKEQKNTKKKKINQEKSGFEFSTLDFLTEADKKRFLMGGLLTGVSVFGLWLWIKCAIYSIGLISKMLLLPDALFTVKVGTMVILFTWIAYHLLTYVIGMIMTTLDAGIKTLKGESMDEDIQR